MTVTERSSKHRPSWPMSLALIATGALIGLASPGLVRSQSGGGSAVLFAPTGEKRLIHQAIIGEIKSARKSIDVAIFNFTSRRLTKALLDQAKKVRIRVLFDERSAKAISISQHKELKGKGVAIKLVRLPGKGVRAPKFHHKFCVIDNREVLTGSYNWTVLADEKSYENLVVIRDKKLAKKFSKEFERIWNNKELAKDP